MEWTDTTGTLSLVERPLPERWAGKRLSDINTKGDSTLVSVTRAGVARLDIDDLVGQDGDVLHLMVTNAALRRLDQQAAEESGRPDGGGSDGRGTVTAAVPVTDDDLEGDDR